MEETNKNLQGTFKADLMRNFKELKASRAESVVEDTEITYKRCIEDLCHKIRNYDRDRENLILDLSPSNAFSGKVVPTDFDASTFMNKDIEIGLSKRDAVIRLEIAVSRYEELFGQFPDRASILRVLPDYKFKITE